VGEEWKLCPRPGSFKETLKKSSSYADIESRELKKQPDQMITII